MRDAIVSGISFSGPLHVPRQYRVFLGDFMTRSCGYRVSLGLYGRELRIPCFFWKTVWQGAADTVFFWWTVWQGAADTVFSEGFYGSELLIL
eukprot:1996016-Karenia_brevis.AAC.1